MANFLRSFWDRRVFRVLPGQKLSGQVLGEEVSRGGATPGREARLGWEGAARVRSLRAVLKH